MNLTAEQWFSRLHARRLREQATIQEWWDYYEGNQALYYVAKILEEQQDRFPALTINWPAVIAEGISDRSRVEGFFLNGSDEYDDELWGVWQRNDLDEFQSENHISSLVAGVSYMIAGPGDLGPLLTVESPESMTVEVDPRTRRVVAALKVWKSDAESAIEDRAVLMLPGRLIEFENGKPAGEKRPRWMTAATKLQTSPEVPVVPFFNKQRQRVGRSELTAIRPLVDAANQIATNMMAGVEHQAVPRKYALGVDKSNFIDPKTGEPLPAWKIATGAVWVNPFDPENPEAKPEVGQFAAADIRNFDTALSLIARCATGVYGLPPHRLGFNIGDNPAAADGIRASEVDWVARIENRHVSWGSAYERLMRLAMAILGRDPNAAVRLETHWRNPATPTLAARADAAAKAYTSGISDLRQARLDYGYSLTQIKAMEEREAAAVGDPTLERIARELMSPTAPGQTNAPASNG